MILGEILDFGDFSEQSPPKAADKRVSLKNVLGLFDKGRPYPKAKMGRTLWSSDESF